VTAAEAERAACSEFIDAGFLFVVDEGGGFEREIGQCGGLSGDGIADKVNNKKKQSRAEQSRAEQSARIAPILTVFASRSLVNLAIPYPR
jgi:hypothetical protein